MNFRNGAVTAKPHFWHESLGSAAVAAGTYYDDRRDIVRNLIAPTDTARPAGHSGFERWQA